MASKAEEELTAIENALKTVAKPVGQVMTWLLPKVIKVTGTIYKYYMKLPQNGIEFVQGTAYCFFGGVFPTLFSAIQAAEYGGRRTFIAAVEDLTEEVLIVIEASKKDDEVDADGDGVADVDQIDVDDYIERKFTIILKKVNPQKVDAAIGAIYTVWLSVAAVLQVEFAAVISISLALADFIYLPVNRFITPVLVIATPDEYDKWIPVVLHWITKAIAMSLAWYIASIRYAFTSATKGGLLMAQGLFKACVHRGYTLGGLIPKNHKDSNLDELLSYVFAALGFYFQFSSNFDIPFPLDLLLWPLEVAEWWIRWTITEDS